MQEQHFLLLAFLGQILFLSGFFPARMLATVRDLIRDYPPSQYGKLYPVSEHERLKAQTMYKYANLLILLIGLALVAHKAFTGSSQFLSWDSQSVIAAFALLQFTPWIIVLLNPGFTYFNMARQPNNDGKRTASMARRRLLDFVSPKLLAIAFVTYLIFVALVVLKPELWNAGYWNLLFVTLLNIYFAGVIAYLMYSKKKDSFQASIDRNRQIGLGVKTSVISSIAATSFLIVNVLLQSQSDGLRDISMCCYFVLMGLIALQTLNIDQVDFEVYRGDSNSKAPQAANRSGALVFIVAVFLVCFAVSFIAFHHTDQAAQRAGERVTTSTASSPSG